MTEFKRRDFIRNTVIAGVSTPFVGLNSPGSEERSAEGHIRNADNPRRVVIGGGGLGGLCCGYELMKSGHDVTILEASGRHGGHVYTARDELSDGLYGDYGMEHITRPGYDRYWEYIDEFNLTALSYPRRKNVLRRIDNAFYTEEMLSDPAVLDKMGFNKKEVAFLAANPWWDLKSLFLNPYLDNFTDEYQPFGVGYDDWDKISVRSIYEKDGASPRALGRLGGAHVSALYELWHTAILKIRGVPTAPPEVYRLKGGNQQLPDAFAKRLGNRLWLNSRIINLAQDDSGVLIKYRRHGEEREITADFFVNCIPPPLLKNIPMDPPWPDDKMHVFENMRYDSYQRFVFQASSKFWEDDGLSINIDLGHPDLWNVWQSAEEVDTHRVIILGTGPGGVSPQRALAAFRELYPGKRDSIEQAISMDWTKHKFASNCERLPFPIGELARFWPNIIEPHGRIYFAGAYADNLNWGTEACTRSANRVAKEIDSI